MDELKKYLQEKREELDTAVPPATVWDKIHSDLHPGQTLNKTADREQGRTLNKSADLQQGRNLNESADLQTIPPPDIHTDLRPFPNKLSTIKLYRSWIAAAAILLITAAAFFTGTLGNRTSLQLVLSDSTRTHVIREILGAIPKPEIQIKRLLTAIDTQPAFKTMDTVVVVGFTKKESPAIAENPAKINDPVESFEASYASLVEEQLKQLRKLPVYVDDPGYFGLFKQQFNDLEKEETNLKNRMKKEGVTEESLEGLVVVYQQKINILRNLQFEINRTNSKITEHTSGQDLKPTYINLQ